MSFDSLRHRAPLRRRGLSTMAVFATPLLVLTGCGDSSLDPLGDHGARFSLAATFPDEASEMLDLVDAWRVRVIRPGEGVIAEDSGTVTPDQVTVTVELSVTLQSSCEMLTVVVELSSGGEVWFRSEKLEEVCAGPGNGIQAQELQWVGPSIEITSPPLSFSVDQASNPSPQTFTVGNSGGGVMAWSATADETWLEVSPASGTLMPGGSETLTATVTSDILNPDQYQGAVVITAPNAANSPRSLPVSLTVIEVANSVLQGRVSAEETGLGGVTVSIAGKESRSTDTDASGRFEFSGLTAGDYTVSLSGPPSDVSFPSLAQNVSLGVNDTMPVDFPGTYIRTSTVTGAVTADGVGLADVTVTLSGTESHVTFTDASGNFASTGLRAGSYTVSVSDYPPDVTFPSPIQNLTLAVGEARVVDFPGAYIRTSAVQGVVTLDGVELADVTVTLTGTESRVTFTDASGNYEFTGLRAGSYTVSVSEYPPDVTFPSPSQNVTLAMGEARVLDFPGSYVRTSTIQGRVTAGGEGLSGVMVSLTGTEASTTSTNSSGDYQFAGLLAGDYTVTISDLPDGAVFETTSRNTSVAVGETVQINFSGEVIPLPSTEFSYFEACPAVLPRPAEITKTTTLTTAVRDQFGNPITGATVSLSLLPPEPDFSFFGSTFLFTGLAGNASTTFYSELTGPKTFHGEITANGSTIVIQESDDLWVDIDRWNYEVFISEGAGQTIVAGESGSFAVQVLTLAGAPASGVPVGWDIEGGNCLYSFTTSLGSAGMSLYVPLSTAPGVYHVIANIATVDWDTPAPWELLQVDFAYTVVASAGALMSPAQSPGASRLQGRPIPAGGR